MIWNLVASNPPPVTEDNHPSRPFLGWAKREAPAVFFASRYPHPTYDKVGYYILHDYEGLQSYTPTHWLPIPELPEN